MQTQLNISTSLCAALLSLLALALSTPAMAQQQAESFKASYRHNSIGQVTGVIKADPDDSGSHAATRYTYNGRGFLTKIEHGLLNSYHPETTAPQQWSNFNVLLQEVFTYDALGRKLTSATADANGNKQTLLQYSYDTEDRVICKAVRMNPNAYSSLPSSACSLGSVGSYGRDRITRYTYAAEGYGSVTKEERAVGTALRQDYFTYEYDSYRRVIGITDANGNYTHKTYDDKSRLKRMYFPSKTTSYSRIWCMS